MLARFFSHQPKLVFKDYISESIADIMILAYCYLPVDKFKQLQPTLPHSEKHDVVYHNKFQHYFPIEYSYYQSKHALLIAEKNARETLLNYWQNFFWKTFNEKYKKFSATIQHLICLATEGKAPELLKEIKLNHIEIEDQDTDIVISPLLLITHVGRQREERAGRIRSQYQSVLDHLFESFGHKSFFNLVEKATSYINPKIGYVLKNPYEYMFLFSVLCNQSQEIIASELTQILSAASSQHRNHILQLGFSLAAHLGCMDAVEYMLSIDAVATIVNPFALPTHYTFSPLCMAAITNQTIVVNRLLFGYKVSDPIYSDEHIRKALLLACKYGNLEVVKYLTSLPNIDLQLASDPMEAAIANRRQAVIEHLSKQPNSVTVEAIITSVKNSNEEAFLILADIQPNLDYYNILCGRSNIYCDPRFIATISSFSSDEELIGCLQKGRPYPFIFFPKSFDISWRHNLLHVASSLSLKHVVAFLLNHPSTIHKPFECFDNNFSFVSPFHIATNPLKQFKIRFGFHHYRYFNFKYIPSQIDQDMANLYYQYAPEQVDLAYALTFNLISHDMLLQLLKDKTKANVYGGCGYEDDLHSYCIWRCTPVYAACVQGNMPALTALLENGAAVNSFAYTIFNVSYEYTTPLHCAIERNDKFCMRELLAYGADVMLRNSLGYTPVDLGKTKDILPELLLCEFLQKSIKNQTQEKDKEIAAAQALFNVLFLKANPNSLKPHLTTLKTKVWLPSPLQLIYHDLKDRLMELIAQYTPPTLATASKTDETIASSVAASTIEETSVVQAANPSASITASRSAALLVSFSSIFISSAQVASLQPHAASAPYDNPHEIPAQQTIHAVLPGA